MYLFIIFKVYFYLFVCFMVNLDFKHVSWLILIKAVLWKPLRHTELLGCIRHT